MSNGPFAYTPEQVEALFAQFSKAMELANERKRLAETVSQALQAVIGDHNIIVVPKVTVTPVGKLFHVTSNFGSAAEAIEAGNYDLKWGLAEKPAEIPLIVQPVDARVRAVPLGRVVKTAELFELYPRIVDPMTLFTFGAKFQEEQREALHFTVWKDAIGRFWYALLDVDGRGRVVSVNRVHPGGEWRAAYRLLLREFLSASGGQTSRLL